MDITKKPLVTVGRAVVGLCLLLFFTPSKSLALPMPGTFTNQDHCDAVSDTELTHELGEDAAIFGSPPNAIVEGFAVIRRSTVSLDLCGAANAGGILDWEVFIRNLSAEIWADLHFVMDVDIPFDNWDGEVFNPRSRSSTRAFRLDNAGINNIGPSSFGGRLGGHNGDNLFEPGETWRIRVQDFDAPMGRPPVFKSSDFGDNSPLLAPPLTNTGSTASILANHVGTDPNGPPRFPEPSLLLGLGTLALAGGTLLRRKRR